MKLITSQSLTAQNEIYVTLPAGNYNALLLSYTGTAGAPGVSLVNMGNIRLEYRGTEIINTDVSFFLSLGAVWDRYFQFTTPGAGAFTNKVHIPFYSYTQKKNGIPVKPSDNVYLRINWDNTNITAGVITVYGIETKIPFSYFNSFRKFDKSIGGAGTARELVQALNVERIYTLDTTNGNFAGALTRVEAHVDNKVRINADPLDIFELQRFRYLGTSGFGDLFMLNEYLLTGGHNILEAINRNTEIYYTTNAAISPLSQYYSSIGFNDSLIFESQEIIAHG